MPLKGSLPIALQPGPGCKAPRSLTTEHWLYDPPPWNCSRHLAHLPVNLCCAGSPKEMFLAFIRLSNHWDPNYPSLLTTHLAPSGKFLPPWCLFSQAVFPIPCPSIIQVRRGIVGWFLPQRWLCLPMVYLHVDPSLVQLPQSIHKNSLLLWSNSRTFTNYSKQISTP